QWRAHADPLELRQERGILPRESPGAVPAHHPRPRLPLRSRQRGGPATEPELVALVDEAGPLDAPAFTRPRRGIDHIPASGQSEDLRLPARAWRRAGAGGRQPVTSSATGGTRPFSVPGARSGGNLWPHAIRCDRWHRLYAHPERARILLVLAGAGGNAFGYRCRRDAIARGASAVVGRSALGGAFPGSRAFAAHAPP